LGLLRVGSGTFSEANAMRSSSEGKVNTLASVPGSESSENTR